MYPLKQWAGDSDTSRVMNFATSFACLTFLCFFYSQTDAGKAIYIEISKLLNRLGFG
jgi:hypothetical protein